MQDISKERSVQSRFTVGKAISQIENIFLILIALLTVIGAGKEVYLIGVNQNVGLQDLLLMFLYVEVLAMVGTYYDSKKIPITLPIFIAITALARVTILQKDQEPINLLYETGAILILTIASVVVRFRFSREEKDGPSHDHVDRG
jgi:protein PsiE